MAELQTIPLDNLIVTDIDRSESETKDVIALTQSIRALGLLTPIVVAPDAETEEMYRIVAGKRRFYALKKLKEIAAPCYVLDDFEEEGDFEVRVLTDNLQRRDIDPIQRAKCLSSLLEGVYEGQKDLADDLGVSQSWVSRQLALLSVDDGAQQEITKGEISAKAAQDAVVDARKEKKKKTGSKKLDGKVKDVAKQLSYVRLPVEAFEPEDEAHERNKSFSIAVGEQDIKFSVSLPIKIVKGRKGLLAALTEEVKTIGEKQLLSAIRSTYKREFS